MKKLYGVHAYFKNSKDTKRDYVYYVESEEEAKAEFLNDWNNRTYLEISGVYPIETNRCTIDYQLQREIYWCDEFTYNILEGDYAEKFYIEVKNVRNFGDIIFKPLYVHSQLVQDSDGERYELSLMVCLYDGRPNWLY